MATPQLSPGVLIREVDLTVGRADNVLDNIGAISGPFPKGPVEEPVDITTESELIDVFGEPQTTDGQYQYWMTASAFLSYGGVMKVVRCSGDNLNNANAIRTGIGTDDVIIKNFEDYEANWADDIADYIFVAKNPGTWANNLKVAFIDDKADQIIGIKTDNLTQVGTGISVGAGISFKLEDQKLPGRGQAATFDGVLKGIITGITTTVERTDLEVKIVSRVRDPYTEITNVRQTTTAYNEGASGAGTTDRIYVNSTLDVSPNDTISVAGLGYTTSDIYGSALVVSVGGTFVTIGSTVANVRTGVAVSFTRQVAIGASEIFIDYADKNQTTSFRPGNNVTLTYVGQGSTTISGISTFQIESARDWYDNQFIRLQNTNILWRSIAPKPTTTRWAQERNSRNDAMHIAVIDDLGTVTGIKGNLLEKHVSISKASDATSAVNAPQKIWWKDYLARYSRYLFAGDNPSDNGVPSETVFRSGFSDTVEMGAFGGAQYTLGDLSDQLWNQPAQDITYSVMGNVTYTLGGGKDYSGENNEGGLDATLGDLISAYRKLENRDEVPLDYILMGPGLGNKFESQAKAQEIIAIAEDRKDCMAMISPHRADVVDITNTDTQTDNIIEFYSSMPSSSYAVFDTGYKYTYDRFNNKFRYIPTNGDIAGLCVRTSIFAYPWFSPAGQQRGILNNAIKLAYNPSKAQRDQLYPQRINAVVTQPGIGTLLFGDKTGLGYASAFDRINVRRLFLTVEQALERSAQAQLFELNDEITRANFINIVEPYLREVQAKRGLYGFLVVCDETNNTPDIIDNNEFRADIYLKPAKSINYVTLTFVATRTGVSFEEVAGRV
jgi:hypothetical protein